MTLTLTQICISVLLRPNSEDFFYKLEGKRRRGYRRMNSVTVSRRYTHSDACCEWNALLWLQNMSTSRKDAMTPFSTSSAIVGLNSSQGT